MKSLPQDCARCVLEILPRITGAIRAEMRAHGIPELTPAQFHTLAFLGSHERASLSAVAAHVGLTLPSASKAIENLVARKLARRSIDPGDRRCVALALTARGKTKLETARETAHSFLSERLSGLSAADNRRIVCAFESLRHTFSPEAAKQSVKRLK
jgi:DNA-binding MarR family transcriptional regulator